MSKISCKSHVITRTMQHAGSDENTVTFNTISNTQTIHATASRASLRGFHEFRQLSEPEVDSICIEPCVCRNWKLQRQIFLRRFVVFRPMNESISVRITAITSFNERLYCYLLMHCIAFLSVYPFINIRPNHLF